MFFRLRIWRCFCRDLWDIAWISRQGIDLPENLVHLKIQDHRRGELEFVELLQTRLGALKSEPEKRESFIKEMRRFLPAATVRGSIETRLFWSYLTQLVEDLGRKAIASWRKQP